MTRKPPWNENKPGERMRSAMGCARFKKAHLQPQLKGHDRETEKGTGSLVTALMQQGVQEDTKANRWGCRGGGGKKERRPPWEASLS